MNENRQRMKKENMEEKLDLIFKYLEYSNKLSLYNNILKISRKIGDKDGIKKDQDRVTAIAKYLDELSLEYNNTLNSAKKI